MKAMLVAQREFLENMRTKTFWIGILSFPVIIALAIVIGRLLEKSKDVRTYAVIDRSEGEWLSRAIYSRVSSTDLTELLRKRLAGDAESTPEQRLQTWLATLPDDHPLRALDARLTGGLAGLSAQVGDGDPHSLPAPAREAITAWALEIARDPKQVKLLTSLAADLAMAKYRRVVFDDLGEAPEKALNDKLAAGELFAYFVIGDDPVASAAGSTYVSNNVTDDDLRKWFAQQATEIVREARIRELDLSPAEARSILDDFRFAESRVSATGEVESVKAEEKASSFAPIAFVYLLWIAVFTAANMLLTNTIEEKSNRLIEVLLSSVSPMQLMSGKVIGIGATGLTIVVAWIVSALIAVRFAPGGLGGVDLASIIGDPLYLASFVGYFLAGYLLYAAFLVAIGSVCNSLKEAQGLMQPVIVVLIVPLLAMVFVVQDPNGTVARFLTYVPLFTPFLMMNRAGGPPPAWEYAATSVLLAVSLVIAFWGAAKIFRVGILMTGKPPRVREILHWLRAPVGQVAVRKDP